ncbi:MAG: hypothetical protein KBB11_02330 [Bacteroidales bacterium]|nr:hypothetical protein [Bacteroidales bacterium]HOY39195.1 hypothetical protein [Bacteroidales bacterium]HQP03327.1 hypothetical protein [Bacteroidales bacterium]
MKKLILILTSLTGLLSAFFIWLYVQRASLDYNDEGRIFCAENGVVYHEQAKEVYGILALLSIMVTGILVIVIIKRKLHKRKKN